MSSKVKKSIKQHWFLARELLNESNHAQSNLNDMNFTLIGICEQEQFVL